jgi:hypothetical protein
VGDRLRLAVGLAVGNRLGLAVGLAVGLSVGYWLGLFVRVDVLGDLLGLADELAIGLEDGLAVVVSFTGSGSQTVSAYMILARVLQLTFVELKNPINFHDGRMVEFR